MAMFDYNVYGQGQFSDLCVKVECYSDDIAENYNGEKISFLFIDGFHSFKQVINDFRTVLPYMSDDAIVAFHDVSPEIKQTAQEDIDWAKYWLEKDYKVIYEPKSSIYHYHKLYHK